MKKEETMIQVSCAVIIMEGKLLAARRLPGKDQAMKWELPGGKVEEGETVNESVVRELKEELDIVTRALGTLESVIHQYPEKTIELIPVRVEIVSGTVKPLDHHEIRWVSARQADSLDWAEADRKLVEKNRFFGITD